MRAVNCQNQDAWLAELEVYGSTSLMAIFIGQFPAIFDACPARLGAILLFLEGKQLIFVSVIFMYF